MKASTHLEEKAFLQSGVILMVISLLSSVVHYVFQAAMGRMLPRDEYGYMNSAFGIVLLASVPLSAASQTVAHYLARLKAEGNQKNLDNFRQQSLTWLWRGTWALILISILLWKPAQEFLRFPRYGLALVSMFFLPAQLWSVVAAAWCAGMGRFKLLGYLTLGAALTRLLGGIFIVWYWSVAESGVFATLIGALVMGGALFFIPRDRNKSVSTKVLPQGFISFLFASIGVGVGNFLFLQADQIIAQRYFTGIDLGNYSAAGVLGRAVILGSLPFLTVYFTQRSEIHKTNRQSWNLKLMYFSSLIVGVLFVLFGSNLLCQILLGHVEHQTTVWMDQFALTMLNVGILHALSYFFLATRRIKECVIYGFCGITYAAILLYYGKGADQMLVAMKYSTLLFLGLVLLLAVVGERGRKQRKSNQSKDS